MKSFNRTLSAVVAVVALGAGPAGATPRDSAVEDDVTLISDTEAGDVAAKGTFERGYCTWYADQMVRSQWGKTWKSGTSWQGDAHKWLQNAAAKGLSTGKSPQTYAIAVFGPSKSYSQWGHVAFVTAVDNKKSTFTITEMNYTGFNKTSTRTLPFNTPGLTGFIYKPSK